MCLGGCNWTAHVLVLALCVLGGCNGTVHVLVLSMYVYVLGGCNGTVNVQVLAMCESLVAVTGLYMS